MTAREIRSEGSRDTFRRGERYVLNIAGLQRAQDEKVIVKVEDDRHTFYHPAPF